MLNSQSFPESSQKFRIDLTYRGTSYHGWQIQKDLPTIQEAVRKAVRELFQEEEIHVHGASRTDAGVHALKQVAHFRANTKREPDTIVSGVNHHLPGDISVTDAETVKDDFHAAVSSTGKTYLYVLLNRSVRPALEEEFVHWVPSRLNLNRMQKAIEPLAGRRNFTSLATDADNIEDPVCWLKQVDLLRYSPYIVLLTHGDRFLYNMVRTLAGTLVEIGKGNRDPDDLEQTLTRGDRTGAGPVLEASGLFLARVHYRSLEEVQVPIHQIPRWLFLPGVDNNENERS